MKLEKFEKFCQTACNGCTKNDLFLFLVSFILCALAKDLNLTTLFNVSGSIFLMLIMWYVCTFICLVVLVCVKKHKSKKTNIEKLIDEEVKRESKFDDKRLEESYQEVTKAVDDFVNSLDEDSKKGE